MVRINGRQMWCAIASVALVLAFAVVRMPALIGLVLPTAVGLMALAVGLRRLEPTLDEGQLRKVRWWTIVSFCLHLFAGLIITNTALSLYLGGDAFTYHNGAIAILRHWHAGFPLPDNLPSGKEGYYYILAGLYWMVGVSTSAGLVLNATLAAALVPLLTDTTRRLFGGAATRKIAPLAVLLPGLFLWTSQLLKEACVLFLMVAAINCALRLARRITPGALVMVTLSLTSLLTFRPQIGFVVAASILIGLAGGREHVLSGLGAGLGALSVIAVLVTSIGLGYAGFNRAITTDLKQANTVRLDLSVSAASGFARDSDISTTSGALSYLPKGLTALLVGPFPWQIGSVRELPALPDAMVWWCLLPALWRGCRAGWRLSGRRLLILLVPGLAAALVLSLGTGNFGTVVRERTQVVVLVLPLIAFGMAETDRRVSPPGAPDEAALSIA